MGDDYWLSSALHLLYNEITCSHDTMPLHHNLTLSFIILLIERPLGADATFTHLKAIFSLGGNKKWKLNKDLTGSNGAKICVWVKTKMFCSSGKIFSAISMPSMLPYHLHTQLVAEVFQAHWRIVLKEGTARSVWEASNIITDCHLLTLFLFNKRRLLENGRLVGHSGVVVAVDVVRELFSCFWLAAHRA